MKLTSFSPTFGTDTRSFALSLVFLTPFDFLDPIAKSFDELGMKYFKDLKLAIPKQMTYT